MKEIESGKFKYTQKDVMVGDKKRSVIIINQKPDVKSAQTQTPNVSIKTVSIKKSGCSGCSRKKRG